MDLNPYQAPTDSPPGPQHRSLYRRIVDEVGIVGIVVLLLTAVASATLVAKALSVLLLSE
jgi:hypothetical protein